MKFVKAKIEWVVSIERIPPVLDEKDREKKNAYSPIIIFENQYNCPIFNRNKSNVPLWSAIIFNEEIIGNASISILSYLVDEAPNEFLKLGNKFKLYEGINVVAQGEIIKDF